MEENTTTTDTTTTTPEPAPKKKRGFAAMDPKKVAEIASKGGIAAHQAGTAHKFTTAEAQVAGTKGGRAKHTHRGRTPVNE